MRPQAPGRLRMKIFRSNFTGLGLLKKLCHPDQSGANASEVERPAVGAIPSAHYIREPPGFSHVIGTSCPSRRKSESLVTSLAWCSMANAAAKLSA